MENFRLLAKKIGLVQPLRFEVKVKAKAEVKIEVIPI